MLRPECKLDFKQRQEVEQLLERISASGIGTLEQELYALVYDRDNYKEKAEGVVIKNIYKLNNNISK